MSEIIVANTWISGSKTEGIVGGLAANTVVIRAAGANLVIANATAVQLGGSAVVANSTTLAVSAVVANSTAIAVGANTIANATGVYVGNATVNAVQTSSGLTVSFSNYTAGKVVDLWLTNTSGTSQTFTHGISATNSTVNSTTYTR